MTDGRLYAVPLELSEANALVATWHRHHEPSQGHRFSLGCLDTDGVLHGAAIVGRPVARLAGHPRDVLEVVRLVTDGTRNACSILYAASARAGEALGYRRIQTYILEEEIGTSLIASGWICEGAVRGNHPWNNSGRSRKDSHPASPKTRWAKTLNTRRPDLAVVPLRVTDFATPDLFGNEDRS